MRSRIQSFTPLSGEVIRETDMAILFRVEPDTLPLPGMAQQESREVWIPRSVCDHGDDIEEGDTDIYVSDWFCEREEL